MKSPAANRRSLPHRKKRRGLTLIEVAIVLAIVGIVLTGIWEAATSVNTKNNANQAFQELQTISQNMLTLYQNRSLPPLTCGAGADITPNAIANDMVPSGAVVPTGCPSAINPWGGALKIYSGALMAPVRNGIFRVSFYNIPLQGCIALVLQATGCDPSQSGCPIDVVAVNNTVPLVNPLGATATSPASWENMTPSQAASSVSPPGILCGGNAAPNSGGNNSLEFDFKL